MNSSIVIRCGIVWLIFMAFLFDGGKLLRAQEETPNNDSGTSELPQVAIQNRVAIETEQSSVQDDSSFEKSIAEELDMYDPPDWFKDDVEFNDKDRMLFIETDEPALTIAHAKADLERKSVATIKNTVATWMQLSNPQDLRLSADYVFENLLVDGHKVIKQDLEDEMQAEKVLSDKGLASKNDDYQFYRGYAQFQLTDEFKSYVIENVQEAKTKKRLVRSGLIGGSILTLLAIVFGYLKMETATRGFYSRRLQTISVVVAAAMLALFYWFGQQLV